MTGPGPRIKVALQAGIVLPRCVALHWTTLPPAFTTQTGLWERVIQFNLLDNLLVNSEIQTLMKQHLDRFIKRQN